jgi:hypothetical protein
MRTGSRVAPLLTLMAILLCVYAPGDPPGAESVKPVETVVHTVCGTESGEKSGNRYWCQTCGIWFTPDERVRTGTG